MYVSRIRASGIYGSRAYDVALAPVTLIVGPNWAGKTTILGLIALGLHGTQGNSWPLLGSTPTYEWRVELAIRDDEATYYVNRRGGPKGETLEFARKPLEGDVVRLTGEEARVRLASLVAGADYGLVRKAERADDRQRFLCLAQERGADLEVAHDLRQHWTEIEHGERLREIDKLTPAGLAYLIEQLEQARRHVTRGTVDLQAVVQDDQAREAALADAVGDPGTVAHWRGRIAELEEQLDDVAQQIGAARVHRQRHDALVERIKTLTERLGSVDEEFGSKIDLVRENKRALDEQTHRLLTMLAAVEEQLAAARTKALDNVGQQKAKATGKLQHGLQLQEEAIGRRLRRLEIERAAILPDLQDARQRARTQHEAEAHLQRERAFMLAELQEQLNEARRELAEADSGDLEALETLREALRAERAEAQKRADRLSDQAALRADWDRHRVQLTQLQESGKELDHALSYARSALVRRMKRHQGALTQTLAQTIGPAMGGAPQLAIGNGTLTLTVRRDDVTTPARRGALGKLGAIGLAMLILQHRDRDAWRPLLADGLDELDDVTLGRLLHGANRARHEGLLTQWIGTTTRAAIRREDVPDLNPDDAGADVRIVHIDAETNR